MIIDDLQSEIESCARAGKSFERQSDLAFASGDPVKAARLYRYSLHCFEQAERLAAAIKDWAAL